MSNHDDPKLTGRTRRSRWPIVLTAVLALVIGGGAGYAVRALTTDTPAPIVVAAPAPPPAPAVPPSAACAATAQTSAELADQLRRGVAAIQNLDPTALRMVLDQVQGLQGRLTGAVRDCSGSAPPSPPPGG